MKPILVAFGLLALAVAARAIPAEAEADAKQLIAEMQKQEHTVHNKSISELAHGIVAEVRACASDVASFVNETVHSHKKNRRSARALDDNEEASYDLNDLLKDIAQMTSQAERSARSDDASSSSFNEVDSEVERQKGGKNKGGKGGSGGGKIGGAIIPKPVLVPIPGPQGPPGPPGLPGLPGIPGKSPNLKGLKAILLARLARILLLIKALAVACFGLNAALLATTLGLTLPLYKKFKKAGVIVPIEEQEQPSYGSYEPQPSYGPPAPAPYQRRSDNVGSIAPIPEPVFNNVQNQVFKGIKKANKKFAKQ